MFDKVTGRRMRAAARLPLIALMLLTLAGCLYPKDKLKQNVAPKEAVRNVQAAVDQYFSETGLLPIQNADADVPKYEKFKIDFGKLQTKGYLSSIPVAAFENGGNYYFLVIDEETEPRIKLMDIVTFQKINDVQSWVRDYRSSNGGSAPLGDELYPGFYAIDYGLMNRKAPEIRSVYSGQTLGAMIDADGNVYADYGIDIMQLLQREGAPEADSVTDLRELLADSSDYVPVKSPAYTLVNGEPQAVLP